MLRNLVIINITYINSEKISLVKCKYFPLFGLQVNLSANENLAAAVHLLSSIASRLQCSAVCTGSALIPDSARYLMITS